MADGNFALEELNAGTRMLRFDDGLSETVEVFDFSVRICRDHIRNTATCSLYVLNTDRPTATSSWTLEHPSGHSAA